MYRASKFSLDNPEGAALQFASYQLKGNTDGILRTLPPAQRRRVDSQSVALSEKERIQAEVLGSYFSVSADTSVIQGKNGYVRVVIKAPDLKQMMSRSERMRLYSAFKSGDFQEAKSRLEKAVSKSESIPTQDQYKKVYVIRSGKEWSAVLRSDIQNRIEMADDSAQAGNWAATDEALASARKLAPMMDRIEEFASDLAEYRIERASDSLENGDVKEAEKALAYAKKHAGESEHTEWLSKKLATAKKEIAYADSVSVTVRSTDFRYSVMEPNTLLLTGKFEVQNRGQQDISGLRQSIKVTLSSSALSVKDTTVTLRSEHSGFSISGQEKKILGVRKEAINNLDEEKAETAAENGVNNKEIKFTPVRVSLGEGEKPSTRTGYY